MARSVREAGDFIGWQKQQAVLLEKFAAARLADGAKSLRMRQQSPGQIGRGLLSKLRRRGVNNNDNAKLGKLSHILQRALCPRQVRRYECVYVGLDGEVLARVDAVCRCEENCRSQDPQWAPDAEINHG
ncbi:MAG TPA: hypothetical protein VKT99_18190 [Xanthobacteraceae bacterium]|nr:hypothetical protein [Xanthobacteraceae bacterium]